MAELKGTKTEKNLMEAFAGESMARNKYTYFASKAKKDGYQQIAAIFEETAANEKEHAKLWFKLLCGGAIPSTEENLAAAAAGENEEWTDMYARMAEEADAEGFADIAQLFRRVGAIEKEHEARYLKLLDNVRSGIVNRAFYPMFVKAKKFRAGSACIGCGKCAALCPTKNIHIEGGRPVWGDSCTHCMACICRCPTQAIEYGRHTVGLRRYYLDSEEQST